MSDTELFARATLDSLSAHIAIIDGSGEIVAVNKAWREFAAANNATDNVSEGVNYLHVCDSAVGDQSGYAAAFAEGIRAVLRGEREEFAMEYPCHSPSEHRWFIGRVTLFRNNTPQAVVAHENITQRKLAEEALASVLRTRTDFMADVSHELRTPLTVIRGNAEVGMQRVLDPTHREMLEEILQETERMTRMVEDLLLLARSDSGSLPLTLEPMPIATLLLRLSRRAHALARERGASLRTAMTGEGRLRCDVERIEQAVLVLVDNAAKYGPPEVEITLSSRTRQGELLIEVADRGPGIRQEELPRIFERFYRGESPPEERGSGLGLPIAKTIIEAHGGYVEAVSRVGEGTRMSIYLPLLGDS
ncbi:MAG TPA: ATP-binding protein [Rubrobacteraceae bacterium]|nr:ATP-binding protein [Rubrobacteraceae bacterium]